MPQSSLLLRLQDVDAGNKTGAINGVSHVLCRKGWLNISSKYEQTHDTVILGP